MTAKAFSISLEPAQSLRYGENPDQEAAFYRMGERRVGLAALEQLHGKELSYNNLLDLDGALLSLSPFSFTAKAAACIVKHTTPCGLAVADTLVEAYRRALRTDPTSAFGSVIAVNRVVDEATAAALAELFIECLVAPGYDEGAIRRAHAEEEPAHPRGARRGRASAVRAGRRVVGQRGDRRASGTAASWRHTAASRDPRCSAVYTEERSCRRPRSHRSSASITRAGES